MAARRAKILISVYLLSGVLLQACGDKRPLAGASILGADENPASIAKENINDRKNFKKRFQRARVLLDSRGVGREILSQLDKKNSYDEPIEIVAVSPTRLTHYNLGGLSGIRKSAAGKYEILINVDLSVDSIAYGLASGLELFKVAIDEELFFKHNPTVGENLAAAKAALRNGSFKEYATKNRADGQFVLKGIFFAEIKAMEACLKLKGKIALPLEFPQNIETEIYNYVYETHITPLTDPDSQFTPSEFYNLIAAKNFQKISELYAFFLGTN